MPKIGRPKTSRLVKKTLALEPEVWAALDRVARSLTISRPEVIRRITADPALLQKFIED